MADDQCEWQSWMRRLAAGDERVVREFWDSYGARLQRLAAEYLATRLMRRVGPEDIVQSVCRSFLLRAREGQFQLADADSLWSLLCAITLTKVRQKARFHGRQRRNMVRELHGDGSHSGQPVLPDAQPTPAEAAEFADQLEQVLNALDDEERQVVLLRLEQCSCEEVAQRLGCSERTVRRILKRLQTRLRQVLETSDA
jgi:RNA polymerase sigma factor (sigma-70 family)